MWQQFTIDTVNEKVYINNAWVKTTTPKLVTTMGHSIVGTTATEAGTDGLTETPIRWYAFAVKGESFGNDNYIYNNEWNIAGAPQEDRWYSLYGVDMSKVSNYKNHTYWFIQQYVVAGGYEFIGGNPGHQEGISFNKPGDNLNNTYAQVNNNKKSNIYNFLNSEGDYANKGYAEKTGVTAEELGKIEARNVNESYEVNFTGYNTTTSNSKHYLACQFSSNFWLINHAELGLLCNQPISPINDTSNKCQAYGIHNINGDNATYGASWWLRSPFKGDQRQALSVDFTGVYDCSHVASVSVGVRAAFQIQI